MVNPALLLMSSQICQFANDTNKTTARNNIGVVLIIMETLGYTYNIIMHIYLTQKKEICMENVHGLATHFLALNLETFTTGHLCQRCRIFCYHCIQLIL